MSADIQHSFKALADPTRRGILMHLSQRDMTIGEVTDQFDMTRAAIKKHLNILERGNLISIENIGRECVNKLDTNGIKTITTWLNYFDQFWDKKLDNLRQAIEKDTENSNSNSKKGK